MSITYPFPCFVSVPGLYIYLAGVKHHHHHYQQQQQRLMLTPNPSVSCLKTHHPWKHYLSFVKFWKLWLYINRHQWRKMGIQMAGEEEKLAEKNQRALANQKESCITTLYLPLGSDWDTLFRKWSCISYLCKWKSRISAWKDHMNNWVQCVINYLLLLGWEGGDANPCYEHLLCKNCFTWIMSFNFHSSLRGKFSIKYPFRGQPHGVVVKFICSTLVAGGSLVQIPGVDPPTTHQAMLWRCPTDKTGEDWRRC